uniref:Uncharacterized protein n=1 Tax=Dromaius novaehollandiae TaxID=8790 RepID=A0A8C4K3E2_DRONO
MDMTLLKTVILYILIDTKLVFWVQNIFETKIHCLGFRVGRGIFMPFKRLKDLSLI